MPKKKEYMYFIPDNAYDYLNDEEGRWKYNAEKNKFENFYPKDEHDNYTKILKGEFHISVDAESGGWIIQGDLDLFMKWFEESGHETCCLYDEIPERECCISCGDDEVELIDELCDRCREEDDEE